MVGNLQFRLPPGMYRKPGTNPGRIGCPYELNGPGSYTGVFNGQECDMSVDVYGTVEKPRLRAKAWCPL